MQAFLDDAPLPLSNPTVANALKAAVAAAASLGRIVIEVQLDGVPVGEALLKAPPEAALGHELRLVTIDPRDLVGDALREAAVALGAVNAEQASAARLIRESRLSEALTPLSSAVKTWNSVRDAVGKSTEMLASNPQFCALSESAGLPERASALACALGELRRCIEVQDWSGLADVLGCELADEAAGWGTMLPVLAAGCCNPAPAAA